MQANRRYVRSSCTGAKSSDKSGHAAPSLSRLLHAEVWTRLLRSSTALGSPALASWSSPGRRKTLIWKHVLILPSSCTVTHSPSHSPSCSSQEESGAGRENKPPPRLWPSAIFDPFSGRSFHFVFLTFPVRCVMQESLESIHDEIITAVRAHLLNLSAGQEEEPCGR